ncbi:MAG: DUF4158 domain-containing protein [Bacteroidota bacterium]
MSQQPMATSGQRKYPSMNFSDNFSDEDMARDWTLSPSDLQEINRFRKNARLYIAIQICCVRLYGRFVQKVNDLSIRIIHYLNKQLGLPIDLSATISTRKATYSNYHNNILSYLGFQKFDESVENQLSIWHRKKWNKGFCQTIYFYWLNNIY